jgi:hypothetical protein
MYVKPKSLRYNCLYYWQIGYVPGSIFSPEIFRGFPQFLLECIGQAKPVYYKFSTYNISLIGRYRPIRIMLNFFFLC